MCEKGGVPEHPVGGEKGALGRPVAARSPGEGSLAAENGGVELFAVRC